MVELSDYDVVAFHAMAGAALFLYTRQTRPKRGQKSAMPFADTRVTRFVVHHETSTKLMERFG